jgi:hypothetical protein
MNETTVTRNATHDVGPCLPCEVQNLEWIDEAWHDTLVFLWMNELSTIACCGGHEGTTADVFLAWEASRPDLDDLLQMVYGMLLECNFTFDWEILGTAPYEGMYLCWILRVRCPDRNSGWSPAMLKKVRSDIKKIEKQLPFELLSVRNPKMYERLFM